MSERWRTRRVTVTEIWSTAGRIGICWPRDADGLTRVWCDHATATDAEADVLARYDGAPGHVVRQIMRALEAES